MKNVWNSEQLLKNKTEIQKNLIHQIVGDRLQEGALVTDLIGSIKSQVSKSVVNIVLMNNYFRRHKEQWKKRYLRRNQNY